MPVKPLKLCQVILSFCASNAFAGPAEIPAASAFDLIGLDERPIITLTYFAESDLDIVLDGRLDEPEWQNVPGHDDMLVTDPDTLRTPRFRTLARYLYTDKGMYIGAKMFQPPETLIARLSSRDKFISRDSFGITLDTSGEGLYGYFFIVNLGGSVMDGTILPERQFQVDWDGPWLRATAKLPDGWSAEMFLPWSMMAMPQSTGPRDIGYWSSRKVAYIDESWSTPPLPSTNARFMSALGTFKMTGVNAGQQFAVFPYTSYTYDDVSEEDEYRAGLDLFWRPSSNFQLTATLNPDFGAVETDNVVINLTAFETFFPEKRLFFTEGNEIFFTTPRSRPRSRGGSSSGTRQTSTTFNPSPTTLLNTRRIGAAPILVDVPDEVAFSAVEENRPTELIGAVKTTGQQGGFRYGVMAAFEEDVRRVGDLNGSSIRVEQAGRDFAVARLLYESSGAGRISAGYMATITQRPDYDAIVHGVDAHGLSENGKFSWDAQFINSDIEDEQGYGGLLDFTYVPNRQIRHLLSVDYFDDKLDIDDLGFLQRNDVYGATYEISRNVSQGLERLRNKRSSLVLSAQQNGDARLVRVGAFLRNQWTFLNRTELRTEIDYFPKRWDDRNSRDNGSYRTDDRWIAEVGFGTDAGKKLSASALVGVRQEDLGGWTTRVATGLTYKPNDRVSLELDISYFRRDGWLVYQEDRDLTTFAATDWQPRLALDVFLSARHQLRLTMQWAGIRADEQEFWQVPADDGTLASVTKDPGAATDDFTISRLTAQLRYRWEIGPLSDLFVVYTRGSDLDNQISDTFEHLFRDALTTPLIDTFVIKLRYRFGS